MARWGCMALALLVLLAPAAGVRGEDQAGYTREVKRAAAAHLAALGLILRREVAFADRARDHAAALLAIAAAGRELHPPAPATPESATPASANMLDERIEFDALLDAWLDVSRDLDRAADRGALQEIAPAYRDVAASCKACHDRFRVRVGGR